MEEKILDKEGDTVERKRNSGITPRDVEVTKVKGMKVEKPVTLELKSSMKGGRRVGMIVWRRLNEVICEIYLSSTQRVEGGVVFVLIKKDK